MIKSTELTLIDTWINDLSNCPDFLTKNRVRAKNRRNKAKNRKHYIGSSFGSHYFDPIGSQLWKYKPSDMRRMVKCRDDIAEFTADNDVTVRHASEITSWFSETCMTGHRICTRSYDKKAAERVDLYKDMIDRDMAELQTLEDNYMRRRFDPRYDDEYRHDLTEDYNHRKDRLLTKIQFHQQMLSAR